MPLSRFKLMNNRMAIPNTPNIPAIVRMNWIVRRVRMCIDLPSQGVANAPGRLDQPGTAIVLSLLARGPNANFQDIRLRLAIVAPDRFQDLITGPHLPRMAHR